MWEEIINMLDVEFSVALDNKSDSELVSIFLGAEWELQDEHLCNDLILLVAQFYSEYYDMCMSNYYDIDLD